MWIVNEIDDSGAVGVGGWAGAGVSDAFGVAALALGSGVALMAAEDGVLAIARPNPLKIDNGSEKSASQCSPVTQLKS